MQNGLHLPKQTTFCFAPLPCPPPTPPQPRHLCAHAAAGPLLSCVYAEAQVVRCSPSLPHTAVTPTLPDARTGQVRTWRTGNALLPHCTPTPLAATLVGDSVAAGPVSTQ
jgi:hypothetical protein